MKNKKTLFSIASLLLTICLLTGCGHTTTNTTETNTVSTPPATQTSETVASTETANNDTNLWITFTTDGWNKIDVPYYSGKPYVEINNNVPLFTDEETSIETLNTHLEEYQKSNDTIGTLEFYSNLDSLGRCQEAYAYVGPETLPTTKRGDIGSVKPTGWQSVKYPEQIKDNYLYNRCHLIAYELSAENANKSNLVTGTRYMNIDGMLNFENITRQYIDDTYNHVLYRVTPIFAGNDLVCKGVLMEAYSIEDEGNGLQWCVFAYNVQPKIAIDYTTGDSWLSDDITVETTAAAEYNTAESTYILNTNSKTIHNPDCSSVNKISDKNKEEYTGTIQELQSNGYKPCGICKPN